MTMPFLHGSAERVKPKIVFRSKSSIPLGSARLSCLSLNNLPPSPALRRGSRFTSRSMDDVAPLPSPESFFCSRNHCRAMGYPPAFLSDEEFPAPARAAREAPVRQWGSDRDATHASSPSREGGPTEEGESVYTTLRACVRARLLQRERELLIKSLL